MKGRVFVRLGAAVSVIAMAALVTGFGLNKADKIGSVVGGVGALASLCMAFGGQISDRSDKGSNSPRNSSHSTRIGTVVGDVVTITLHPRGGFWLAMTLIVDTAVAVFLFIGSIGWFHDPSIGSTGPQPPISPSRTPPKGSLGDARQADPCGLLDPRVLSRFGDTRLDSDDGEFERCDVLVSKDNRLIADLELEFTADAAEPDSQTRVRTIGGVTVIDGPRQTDRCERNILLADGYQISITAKEGDRPTSGLCAIAKAATDHAVTVLRQGPVPRRTAPFPVRSLANVNACDDLLGDEQLALIPGTRAQDGKRDIADWGCRWDSATPADAGAELYFSRDNSLTDDGRPIVLGGRRSYESPQENGKGSCVMRIQYRRYIDSAGEPTIELVTLAVYGDQPAKRLCATAEALSTVVAKKLPKS